MKIKILLKKPARIDLLKRLSSIPDVTDITRIADRWATCNIPQEPIAPGGKIDSIFEALGGINIVESITPLK